MTSPLTYGVGAIRRVLHLGSHDLAVDAPSLFARIIVSLAFGVLAFAATTTVASRSFAQ